MATSIRFGSRAERSRADESRVNVFRDWLTQQLEHARAQISLEGLEARFAERSVFGGNDYSFDDEDDVLQE